MYIDVVHIMYCALDNLNSVAFKEHKKKRDYWAQFNQQCIVLQIFYSIAFKEHKNKAVIGQNLTSITLKHIAVVHKLYCTSDHLNSIAFKVHKKKGDVDSILSCFTFSKKNMCCTTQILHHHLFLQDWKRRKVTALRLSVFNCPMMILQPPS